MRDSRWGFPRVRSLAGGEPMRFAMAAPIERNDFDSVLTERHRKRTSGRDQSRRWLGCVGRKVSMRLQAARCGEQADGCVADRRGAGLQNSPGCGASTPAGPDGLVDGKSRGRTLALMADHRRALADKLLGSRPAGPLAATASCAARRTGPGAVAHRRSPSRSTRPRVPGAGGARFAKISARPRHYAQNELAVEAFQPELPRRTGEDPGEAVERRRDDGPLVVAR